MNHIHISPCIVPKSPLCADSEVPPPIPGFPIPKSKSLSCTMVFHLLCHSALAYSIKLPLLACFCLPGCYITREFRKVFPSERCTSALSCGSKLTIMIGMAILTLYYLLTRGRSKSGQRGTILVSCCCCNKLSPKFSGFEQYKFILLQF